MLAIGPPRVDANLWEIEERLPLRGAPAQRVRGGRALRYRAYPATLQSPSVTAPLKGSLFIVTHQPKAPLCKGGWAPKVTCDLAHTSTFPRKVTIPPSRLAPCHLPLHKGGFSVAVGADSISARAISRHRKTPRAHTVRPYISYKMVL